MSSSAAWDKGYQTFMQSAQMVPTIEVRRIRDANQVPALRERKKRRRQRNVQKRSTIKAQPQLSTSKALDDSEATVTGDEEFVPSDTASTHGTPQKIKNSKRRRGRPPGQKQAKRTLRTHPWNTFMNNLHLDLIPKEKSLAGQATIGTSNSAPVPNTELPFWDARAQRELHDSDEIPELTVCSCNSLDESGLMVQCELCLTWQHGHCAGFLTPEQVPEGYLCMGCKNPPRIRESKRFQGDQTWLNKGYLPRIGHDTGNPRIFGEGPSRLIADISTIKKKTNDIAAELHEIMIALKGLRVKERLFADPNATSDDLKPWRPMPQNKIPGEDLNVLFPDSLLDEVLPLDIDISTLPASPTSLANAVETEGVTPMTAEGEGDAVPMNANEEPPQDEISLCKANLANDILETQLKISQKLTQISDRVTALETEMEKSTGQLRYPAGSEADRKIFYESVKALSQDISHVMALARNHLPTT